MNEDKILNELEKFTNFKNTTVAYNESKNIYDVYARIKGNEGDTKDILNNIKELDYTYCDFGIFEFWFKPEDFKKVIKKLKEEFKQWHN